MKNFLYIFTALIIASCSTEPIATSPEPATSYSNDVHADNAWTIEFPDVTETEPFVLSINEQVDDIENTYNVFSVFETHVKPYASHSILRLSIVNTSDVIASFKLRINVDQQNVETYHLAMFPNHNFVITYNYFTNDITITY